MAASAVGLLTILLRPVAIACMSVLNSDILFAFSPPSARSWAALKTEPICASVAGAAAEPSAAVRLAAESLPVGKA
jgi:hypothetical protein